MEGARFYFSRVGFVGGAQIQNQFKLADYRPLASFSATVVALL